MHIVSILYSYQQTIQDTATVDHDTNKEDTLNGRKIWKIFRFGLCLWEDPNYKIWDKMQPPRLGTLVGWFVTPKICVICMICPALSFEMSGTPPISAKLRLSTLDHKRFQCCHSCCRCCLRCSAAALAKCRETVVVSIDTTKLMWKHPSKHM